MEVEIRPAVAVDAEGISRVIIAALRETNAQDYSQDIISRVERSFSQAAVEDLIAQRKVFVAICSGQVIGTASLDGDVVRTVFVSPEQHGQGVGRQLMATVMQAAQSAGVDVLKVPSSVTAEPFYQKLGFSSVREHFHAGERTIVMELDLSVRLDD